MVVDYYEILDISLSDHPFDFMLVKKSGIISRLIRIYSTWEFYL